MDKILEEFGLDFWYFISTSHLVMDLILKISNEKKGLMTDVDQHLIVIRRQTGEKLNEKFLDMNFLYPLVISHFSLPRGN